MSLGLGNQPLKVLLRAQTVAYLESEYKLGQGGYVPSWDHPLNMYRQCDCTGFGAWACGTSRQVTQDFYKRYNGGWLETTAVWTDLDQGKEALFRRIDTPQLGACAVIPDSNGHEGHFVIISKLTPQGSVAAMIHCSPSNGAGSAIAEMDWKPGNRVDQFFENPKVRMGIYIGA